MAQRHARTQRHEMKDVPTSGLYLFKSCLVSTEYPGVESSLRFIFDRLGIDYISDPRQSCCSGLGYYFDVFDHLSTVAVAARNLSLAQELGYRNIVTLCATCYAINKNSLHSLRENPELASQISGILDKIGLSYPDKMNENNIFHEVDILAALKNKIASMMMIDFSGLRFASHHACHYTKVFREDALTDPNRPDLIDSIAKITGALPVEYAEKAMTCGAGFRQRHCNKDLSLSVTLEKLRSLKAEGVEVLFHMCPNCQIQFDRYHPVIERLTGERFGICHLQIPQFIALSMGADPYTVVGIQTHSVPIEPLLKRFGIKVKA